MFRSKLSEDYLIARANSCAVEVIKRAKWLHSEDVPFEFLDLCVETFEREWRCLLREAGCDEEDEKKRYADIGLWFFGLMTARVWGFLRQYGMEVFYGEDIA